MRVFETLLLLVNLLVVGWGFLPGRRPFWLRWLPVLAVVMIPIHLLVEGYRWQLLPAYVLTGVLVLLNLPGLLRKTAESPPPRRVLSVISSLVGLGVWLVAFALPYLLPVPKLPEPSGPYAIGSLTYDLQDPNRDEIYTADADDKREIVVQIWYPAAPGTEGEPVPYIKEIGIAGPAIATRLGQPAFLLDHINLAFTHAIENAPINTESEPFPIIIFSHGLRGFRNQNTAMVEELVSHGYVVATIDHTYGNVLTVFQNGHVAFYDGEALFQNGEPNRDDGNTLVGVWAEDVRFVLNQMALWNGEGGIQSASLFNGRLDLSRVGIFGHSTGGGTAVEFCGRDPRCTAGIGLDAWVEPVSEIIVQNGLQQPFLFMNTPVWLGEENASIGRDLYQAGENATYLLSIEGTDHYNFTDLPLLSPLTPQLGLAGPIDNYYSTEILNVYTLAFFDTYLKGENNDLLQNEPPYPEVQLESP